MATLSTSDPWAIVASFASLAVALKDMASCAGTVDGLVAAEQALVPRDAQTGRGDALLI